MSHIMNGKFEDKWTDVHEEGHKTHTVKVHMAGNNLLVIEEGDDAISVSPKAALWLKDWLQQHAEPLGES